MAIIRNLAIAADYSTRVSLTEHPPKVNLSELRADGTKLYRGMSGRRISNNLYISHSLYSRTCGMTRGMSRRRKFIGPVGMSFTL